MHSGSLVYRVRERGGQKSKKSYHQKSSNCIVSCWYWMIIFIKNDAIMNQADLLSTLGSHPNCVSGERGGGGVGTRSWAGAFSWRIADGHDTRGLHLCTRTYIYMHDKMNEKNCEKVVNFETA